MAANTASSCDFALYALQFLHPLSVFLEILPRTVLVSLRNHGDFVSFTGPRSCRKTAFLDDKYYVHVCKLVRLMKTSIKLELTTGEVDELEEGFA
jgi:hypothetical protein